MKLTGIPAAKKSADVNEDGTPKTCENCAAYPVINGKCLHCGYNH